MSLVDKLSQAIERSHDYDHRVTVTVEDFEEALSLLHLSKGELDYAKENDGSLDVWGWSDLTPENEMDWRLRLVKEARDG